MRGIENGSTEPIISERMPQQAGGLGSHIMIDRLPGFFEGTEMPTAGWWEALWPDPAKVLHAVGLTPGMDVVDLCSGDGWFTLQIAKIARYVVAIDLDPKLLDVTKVRLGEAGISNCDYVAGDAYEDRQAGAATRRSGVPGERLPRCSRSGPIGAWSARGAQAVGTVSLSSIGISVRARRPPYWANLADREQN